MSRAADHGIVYWIGQALLIGIAALIVAPARLVVGLFRGRRP